MSPVPILGVLGGIFHFFQILIQYSVSSEDPNPSLTLTCLLQAKHRLPLGRPYFVGIQQVGLLDLARHYVVLCPIKWMLGIWALSDNILAI